MKRKFMVDKYVKEIVANRQKTRTRQKNCKDCGGCQAQECRTCKYCLDMPKYGGAGTMKQPCVLRTCLNKVVKKHNFGVSRRGRKKVNKNVRETDRDATTELTETGVNGVDGMDLY